MAYRTIPAPLTATELEDRMVDRWGETADKITAGQMLGVDRRTIAEYVKRGYLQETPNGRIIVREAARWIKSNPNFATKRKVAL